MVVLTQDEALQMMLCVYVTLGIFLLLAARNPSAYRSVIAFGGWRIQFAKISGVAFPFGFGFWNSAPSRAFCGMNGGPLFPFEL